MTPLGFCRCEDNFSWVALCCAVCSYSPVYFYLFVFNFWCRAYCRVVCKTLSNLEWIVLKTCCESSCMLYLAFLSSGGRDVEHLSLLIVYAAYRSFPYRRSQRL